MQNPYRSLCQGPVVWGFSMIELTIAFFVTFSATIFIGKVIEARLH
jgi:hypothetical protein